MMKFFSDTGVRRFAMGLALLALLSGCASKSRYHIANDRGPDQPVDVSEVPDAIPRYEPRTIAGNYSPYTLNGRTYHVLKDSKGFVEEGLASWYGQKFHGHNTSNGEVYSMYGMTAAHKTLPIPTYVRVTNLSNGRQAVVRVNDRGPFHDGRIIDLSYAGAKKLGFLQQGTAPVRIEALEPVAEPPLAPPIGKEASATNLDPVSHEAYRLPANTFLQAGAFSSKAAAESLRQKLSNLISLPVNVVSLKTDKLYRVRIGPLTDNLVLLNVRSVLQEHKFPDPHVVYAN